jgi:hypothetical protein
MLRSDYSLKQHHIPEQNPRLHCCENINFTNFTGFYCSNEAGMLKITVTSGTQKYFFQSQLTRQATSILEHF